MYLCLAVLGLLAAQGFPLGAVSGCYSVVEVPGLLTVGASLVVEHKL